jgi:hypothetical protein
MLPTPIRADRMREDRTLRAVLVGMLREAELRIKISRPFASIRFSAHDNPFPLSLQERFRTTSAT